MYEESTRRCSLILFVTFVGSAFVFDVFLRNGKTHPAAAAAAAGKDSGRGGSAGSSPLRLPTIEGEDADEMYQDMQSWS